MLLRSERDLLWLRKKVGYPTGKVVRRIDWLENGWRSLWNPKVKAFTSRSVDGSTVNDTITAASFMGPYAGIIDHLGETLDHFDRIAKVAKYMMPSFDPQCEGFDPKRYWRGPVWAVVNNRVGLGLREIGEIDRAERIRRDTATLCEQSEFYEYFDPMTGEGLGGKVFTWTSSVYLDWAADRASVTKALQEG